MGLFSQEGAVTASAPERMAWTREAGTRRLLLGFAAILFLYFGYLKVSDYFLMQKEWPPLTPVMDGLTVVGTLDGRGNYDRNMFRIIQANQTSRAELTDYGWRSIFDGRSPMFSDQIGNVIQSTIGVDGAAGYAMLEPYLKVGVSDLMKTPNPGSVTRETPVSYEVIKAGQMQIEQTTLGALLDKFAEKTVGKSEERDEAGAGGGGGGREQEHGLAIPAEMLARVCPVALTEAHFSGASVEEYPPTLLQGQTYKVALRLTPEGRSRFYQWSRQHTNESLAFVLDKQLVVAARVEQPLNVSEWTVGPMLDGEAARRLADYVNRRAERK